MSTSIIDVPNEPSSGEKKDVLGMCRYEEGLAKFISGADTPLTIALQGEWGSGKTSLMNAIRWQLVGTKERPKEFHGVWINTWQYCLMNNPAQAIIEILRSITAQVGEMVPAESRPGYSERFRHLFGRLAKVGAVVAMNAVSGGAKAGDQMAKEFSFDTEPKDSDVSALKKEIATLIAETRGKRKGFLFFIDDLDRLEPPVAVQILELLKNIFDLKDCIFILAIDYDVVVKGLQPRFGRLSPNNEREFRSFFDKIIQLPFSMPVGSYEIDAFLIDTLTGIGYLSADNECKNDTLKATLTEIAKKSVGTNPRSLKRLANILSLIRLVNPGDGQGRSPEEKLIDKQIGFALVCLQTSYPRIYQALQEEPDFTQWRPKAKGSNDADVKANEMEDAGNDPNATSKWEDAVAELCENDTYLKSRVQPICAILSRVIEVAKTDNLLSSIERNIRLSAVTHIQATGESSAPQSFHHSSWLTRYWYANLKGALAPLFADVGELMCRMRRVANRMVFDLDIDGVTDRSGFEFKLGSDEKHYLATLTFWTPMLRGHASSDFAGELSAIGRANAVETIQRQLQDIAALNPEHYKVESSFNIDAAFVKLVISYPTLEDHVSPANIKQCAEVFNKLLRTYVSEMRPLIYSERFKAFPEVRDRYWKNHAPFGKVSIYDWNDFVFDQLNVGKSCFSIDAVINPDGWNLRFIDRKGQRDALRRAMEAANIVSLFPKDDGRCWNVDHKLQSAEVVPFLDDVLKNLKSVDWATVSL